LWFTSRQEVHLSFVFCLLFPSLMLLWNSLYLSSSSHFFTYKSRSSHTAVLFLYNFSFPFCESFSVCMKGNWNSCFLLFNGYSFYGLCLTFWTNEFLGSYSNY
jgi:hypothetical protein